MKDRLTEIREDYAPKNVEDNFFEENDSLMRSNDNARGWWETAKTRKRDVRYLLELLSQENNT